MKELVKLNKDISAINLKKGDEMLIISQNENHVICMDLNGCDGRYELDVNDVDPS